MLAMNGRGIPIKNQGQNFLPKLLAINPATIGKTNGINSNGNPNTTSI
jgi:hypothetical protein